MGEGLSSGLSSRCLGRTCICWVFLGRCFYELQGMLSIPKHHATSLVPLSPPGAFRKLVDITFVGAMGPPGGGRNPITPRFSRHFNYISFTELEDGSKFRIFSTIVGSWMGSFQNANTLVSQENPGRRMYMYIALIPTYVCTYRCTCTFAIYVHTCTCICTCTCMYNVCTRCNYYSHIDGSCTHTYMCM